MGVDRSALADRLVAILSDLIGIPSAYPPGDTTEICRYAATFLKEAGAQPEILSRAPGAANCVLRFGAGDDGPSLAFVAQADTVSPAEGGGDADIAPYRAVLRDGRLYGLGAGKAKGSMAVQLWLAAELARRGGPGRGEVTFAFVADEASLGSDGLAFLCETGAVRPSLLVLGARTENQLLTAERGVLWLRVVTRGRAAHADAPSAGDNAVMRMARLLEHLDLELESRLSLRERGGLRSTMTVGTIRGGRNANTVPDHCVVEIDRRLLPGETADEALAEIRDILAEAGEPAGTVSVERLREAPGFTTAEDGELAKAFADAVLAHRRAPIRFLKGAGVTEGRHFAGDGIEIVGFGPGTPGPRPLAEDCVPIDQLADAALIQLGVLERLVGFAGS